jgi:hypothetical protein
MLALCCPALAGEIPTPPVPTPPPANAVQEPTDEVTTDGEIQNDALDSLTRAALDLLALLPSLL